MYCFWSDHQQLNWFPNQTFWVRKVARHPVGLKTRSKVWMNFLVRGQQPFSTVGLTRHYSYVYKQWWHMTKNEPWSWKTSAGEGWALPHLLHFLFLCTLLIHFSVHMQAFCFQWLLKRTKKRLRSSYTAELKAIGIYLLMLCMNKFLTSFQLGYVGGTVQVLTCIAILWPHPVYGTDNHCSDKKCEILRILEKALIDRHWISLLCQKHLLFHDYHDTPYTLDIWTHIQSLFIFLCYEKIYFHKIY